MTLPTQPKRQSPVQKAILILGIATGLIHLVVLNFLLFANCYLLCLSRLHQF